MLLAAKILSFSYKIKESEMLKRLRKNLNTCPRCLNVTYVPSISFKIWEADHNLMHQISSKESEFIQRPNEEIRLLLITSDFSFGVTPTHLDALILALFKR